MAHSLTGQGALITGGAGGFGGAIAAHLIADGAAVTLMGRTRSALEETEQQLRDQHPDAQIQVVVGDAANATDVGQAVEVANAQNLKIVVCTVGGGTMAPLMALSAEVLVQDFERNVVTALHAIRHSAPLLAANGGGSIICTSSTAGGFSFPFMGSYSIAKSGLEALVRVAADELGAHDVRVNAVRPGLVPTKAAKPGILVTDPEQRAAVLREKPLARVGTAADIAAAVRYLAGPESAWMTGAVLPVEGGNHLRRAADLEKLARSVCGDDVIDRALRAELVEAPR
ncbi:SDR family NAD(P)-dependent oxidoreductase [Nocardioides sp. Bht2]|uniref:SDR family NAD(P)-dependent oxidoreductase n=1 Tax=Nocardioides sp. Bht2 TaxID=3392297 RepID=UPI0039B647E1